MAKDERLENLLNNPHIGPTTKKLLQTMEETAAQIDPAGPGSRLEHLGQSLLTAGQRLAAGHSNPFEDLTETDVRAMVALVASFEIATDLAATARAMDAEGN